MAKEENINISETIKKAAKEAANEAAKKTVEELKNSKFIKNELSYFRKVEILLYNYESLKDAVRQKDEDIEYIKKQGLPQKSGSVVIYQTSGGGISGQERYMQIIEKYKLEKMETEREVNRINNALNKIKGDSYFDVIKYKYLVNEKERLTDEQLAGKLNKDQSTITRNKKRLINSIKTILFPQSIKELA